MYCAVGLVIGFLFLLGSIYVYHEIENRIYAHKFMLQERERRSR